MPASIFLLPIWRGQVEEEFTIRWAKRFRFLILALILSGAVNIVLLTALFFSSSEARAPLPAAYAAKKAAYEPQNGACLAALSKLSFRELLSFLTNKEPVEEGLLRRDLALAALVSFHHFNLEKALSGTIEQRRTVAYLPEQKLEVFPGLSDEQFQAVIRYAYEEKWPLTPFGLFQELKNSSTSKEESLIEAFAVTLEFHALEILFQKSGFPQETSLLVHLALEGTWDLLKRLSKEQEQALDFSPEKRRAVLLSYLQCESKTAARLLLETDFSFVLKRLSDSGILTLLRLLDPLTQEGKLLCQELLKSPRTDAVWKLSLEKLHAFEGRDLPDLLDLKEAASRLSKAPVLAPPPSSAYELHTVKEGESLWKIARQYQVSLEDLRKCNELEKDRIVPGMALRIPR